MNRRLAILTAAALALGALAFHQYKDYLPVAGGGAGQPAPAAPPAAAAGPMALNPLDGLGARPYASISKRPLFNPGRLPRPVAAPPEEQTLSEPPPAPPSPPAEPPAPPPTAGPNAGDYRLLGISSGPDGRLAALELATTSEVIYVREGDAVGDWTALEIGERTVVIGSPGSSISLTLFDGADADAAPEETSTEQELPVDRIPPQSPLAPIIPGMAPPDAPEPPGPALN